MPNVTSYSRHVLGAVASALVVLLLLFVFYPPNLTAGTSNIDRPATQQYSYVGRDYPPLWAIPPLHQVRMRHEDSIHYALETELGVAEWNATLPRGGAVLYLGPHHRPFTLSIFHQLRCLDIIRDAIVNYYTEEPTTLRTEWPGVVEHCMNYLRQTALCRANLRLENVRAPSGPGITVHDVTYTCRDWMAVYEAAERNFDEFLSEPVVSWTEGAK